MTKRNEAMSDTDNAGVIAEAAKVYVPMATLIKVALGFYALAQRYEAELANSTYTPAEAQGLRAALARVEQALQAQIEQRLAAKASTSAFRTRMRETVRYRERLVAALNVVAHAGGPPCQQERWSASSATATT